MIASEGFSIFGSGRSSTPMSPGAWRTALAWSCSSVRGAGRRGRPVWVRARGCGWSGAPEDLLGDGHRGEGLRPAGIERQVGDRLDQLLLGEAVVLRVLQVEGQLLGVAARGQRRDRDQAAVTGRQLRALPRVAE